jgi:hypothetical protein
MVALTLWLAGGVRVSMTVSATDVIGAPLLPTSVAYAVTTMLVLLSTLNVEKPHLGKNTRAHLRTIVSHTLHSATLTRYQR